MRELVRNLGVMFVALSFAMCTIPPPAMVDAANEDDAARAVELLSHCDTVVAAAPVKAPAAAAASARVAAVVPAAAGVRALRRSGATTAAAATARARAVTADTAAADSPADDGAEVAQAESPVPEPSPSASGSPTPVPYAPPPVAPNGPQILLPPRPSPSPGAVTPPPVPTPTPGPSGSPGPVIITPETVPPSSSPIPLTTPSSGPVGASPSPSPSAPPQGEVLDPNSYAILGDKLTGVNKPGQPYDLDGHVNVFYQDGVLGGDHAHYDGKRYIDVTGNTFVKNRSGDTVLYADTVRFDQTTQKATLIRGRGESTQGVETGKLHFAGTTMVTDRNGVTHVERANITTCENPRGGYHLESKTLDVYPGDKAVARSAVLFLGALAIFYLPVVVISLRHDEPGTRRQPGFLPLIGYSATEGFYVKARIGFSPSDYYYGYYRVEEYTKIGLGLGYVGTLIRKDGRRKTDVNFFRMKNKVDGSNSNNLTLNDDEAFSRSLRGKFALNYTGNYGPLVSLPPQFDLQAGVSHGSERGNTQNYSFHRSSTGTLSSSNDYGFSDHRAFSSRLSNDFTFSLTRSASLGYPITSALHFGTETHFQGRSYDYDLVYDRSDTTIPTALQKEPELTIHPHDPLFPRFKWFPVTAQYTLGIYGDPEAQPSIDKLGLTTSKGEARLSLGPALAHFLASDFSANVTVQQDAYGTGDMKAQIGQHATLTTSLWNHMVNIITYDETHVNGPFAEPFKMLDVVGNGTKEASDNLRVFNSDIYTVSLTASTFFNRQAQSVGYQITSRPSPRSSLALGGSFLPGPGNGFDRTSVQLATPFGYQSDLQFSTFVDWKNHARLESKNIYYRHIVGNCYEIRLSYSEDLKQVTATVDLLAFPSHAVNFGIGQTSLGSIIPQSLSTSSFGY
ncbi:MAG TPA: hypothetical protein VHS78_14090 [Candidatus Elarobacter sp.]|nr:hypothetical protein [Candidatus Elarobacter sp.]